MAMGAEEGSMRNSQPANGLVLFWGHYDGICQDYRRALGYPVQPYWPRASQAGRLLRQWHLDPDALPLFEGSGTGTGGRYGE